jgi:3-methylcrotonyl-CoA carboxylase beta subunit
MLAWVEEDVTMQMTQESLAEELRERLAAAALGGPEASRARHISRG